MFDLSNPQQAKLCLRLNDSSAGTGGFHALQVPTLAKKKKWDRPIFENWNKEVKWKRIMEKSSWKNDNISITKWWDAAQGYLHNHAEHHEDIPQGDEDSKIPETQQELSDVVT